MLYDDENNVVDDVVLCESGGVEVSTPKSSQRPPPLSFDDSSPTVVTPPFSPPSFSPRMLSPRMLLKCWDHPVDSLELANSSLPSPESTSFRQTSQVRDAVQWPDQSPFEDNAIPTAEKKEDHLSLFDESTVLSDEDSFDSDPFAPRAGKSLCWRDVNMVLVSRGWTS